MKLSPRTSVIILLGLLAVIIAGVLPGSVYRRVYNLTLGRFFCHTVESRLESFSAEAGKRLNLPQPIVQLKIIALKEEKQLELWGIAASGEKFFIKQYRIIAASGVAGTKLREGDRQVPEGFYLVESLHPNSHFYLALKIAYPSAEDILMAQRDKRDIDSLGSNIMLHGKGGSVGCIAVDNPDMEEIFLAAATVGAKSIELLILPYDFRLRMPPEKVQPEWLLERYQKLNNAMQNFRRGP